MYRTVPYLQTIQKPLTKNDFHMTIVLKIHQTLIRPVVTYGGEILTLTDENALGIFERKIYGPVLENGEFRIRYNEDLHELIEGEDIVRFIKAQRLQWLGHVERMNETAMPKRMLQGKIYTTRKTGRHRLDGWRMYVMISVKWK
jgi:hypothetical protein